jgi:glycerol-3-phosphate acyltransferase PlsY
VGILADGAFPALNLGTPYAEIASAVLAILIGGVPFGWLVARFAKGVDLRHVGSGNPGATNCARLWKGRQAFGVFVLVVVLDAAKGFLAAWCSPALGTWLHGASSAETMAVVCGSSAIVGHVFTPYLGFRGGKGFATALGVTAALAAVPAVWAVGFWGIVVAITRYASLGSLVAMVSIPVNYGLRNGADTWHGRFGVFAFLSVCAVVVVWRHRENIVRLLAGRERKIGSTALGSASR